MTEGTNEDLDSSLLYEEEEPKQEKPKEEPSQDPQPEEEIPEKYRGKSAMDIIRMHQDAEKLLGKHSNEVGQLRGIVDDLLARSQQTPSPAPQEPEEEEPDWFADPKAATTKTVRSALESDPELQSLKNEVAESRRERSARALLQKHPDAMEIAQDPKFGEWISKSQVRTRMFQNAHTNFDSETASELLDLWKERQQMASKTANSAKDTRNRSAKQASTGSGRPSSEVRGKPILSRQRLIDLKTTNPDRYYAQIDVIKQAYAEGRVR